MVNLIILKSYNIKKIDLNYSFLILIKNFKRNFIL